MTVGESVPLVRGKIKNLTRTLTTRILSAIVCRPSRRSADVATGVRANAQVRGVQRAVQGFLHDDPPRGRRAVRGGARARRPDPAVRAESPGAWPDAQGRGRGPAERDPHPDRVR